jgi:drug/metabolite transporter (DMT)-like permease
MDWFSVSLLCALCSALADALCKKYLRKYSGLELLLIRFSVPAAMVAPLLLVFPLPSVPMVFWVWIAGLLPLEILAMVLYMQAIRDSQLSQTLPYLAFTPVFNIFTGWLLLGEQVSLLGGVGILLVVIGTYLLNVKQIIKNGSNQWLEPFRFIIHKPGSRRMLIVAIIYSMTSVGTKAAMQYVTPYSFGAFYFVLLGATTLLIVSLLQPRKLLLLKQNVRAHLVIGALMAAMIISHFVALAMVEVAYMIAVKRTSLLFGILLGAYMFHEIGLKRNLSAVALMLIGVTMILLT